TPDVLVSAIASASIMTVGILFIIEDKKAAMNPRTTVTTNNPCSADDTIKLASAVVNPAFLSPYTTTYIPNEKNTTSHGAPLFTEPVETAGLFRAIKIKKIAITPATNDTGIWINSLVKYPINNKPKTYQAVWNIFIS